MTKALSSRQKLTLLGSGLAVSATLALLLTGPFRAGEEAKTAAPPPALETLGCHPDRDYAASFRMQLETQLQFNAAALIGQDHGAMQVVKSGAGLVGRLRVRAVEPRDEGMLLSFQLDQLDGSVGALESEPQLRKQLEQPFVAVLESSCRLRSYGFAKGLAPEVINRLQGLMQGLSVALSGSRERHKSWATQEWDATGLYTAIYRRGEGALAFTKEHLSYVKTHSKAFGVDDTVDVRVEHSELQGRLDADSAWLTSVEDKEKLRVTRGSGAFLADVEITLRLQRRDDDPSALTLASTQGELDWRKEDSAPIPSEVRDPEPPEPMKMMPLEAALAQFAELFRSDQQLRAIDYLKLYLRARPQMADALISMLEQRRVPAQLEPAIFHALEKANTPEAHEALMAGLTDRHTPDNRARAAAALPDISKPDQRTLNALRDMAQNARTSDKHETALVRNAATFALGRLESHVRELDPELAKATRQEMRASLRRARSSDLKAAVLDSIGNSGNPEFIDDLQSNFRSDEKLVRAHAVQALEHMPPESSQGLFRGLMEQEKDPQVRASIATTFADQARRANAPAPSPVIQAAVMQLSSEPDPRVRALLIELIGPACASDPSALEALVQQFARESEPLLLRLIGKWVPAGRLG